MKKWIVLLAALVFFFPLNVHANNAIGTDLVRMLDRNQDDGMMNILYQYALTRNSAIKGSFASGENLNVIEVAYKGYHHSLYQGTYYEVGGMYVDGDSSQLGITAAIGYETPFDRNIMLGGAVQLVMIDEKAFGYADSPIFFPRLYILFNF